MRYIDRLCEINDKIRSALNHDDDISEALLKERENILDAIHYDGPHNWDDEYEKTCKDCYWYSEATVKCCERGGSKPCEPQQTICSEYEPKD